MKLPESAHGKALPWVLLSPGVLWAAVIAAQTRAPSLSDWLANLSAAINTPFALQWTEDTPRFLLVFLLAYAVGIGVYYSTRRNYRRNEEHGSAKWGSPEETNRKYHAPKPSANILLTQHVRIGLDGRKHRRNLNILVVGGSGAGKTRFYCKPNLMQANTSFVVTDPKGENLRDTGNLLEAMGYELRVLDLIDMEKSYSYNPFAYLRSDADAMKLVTNLIRNTTPKNAQNSDPFWERSETALLEALILYLMHEAPEDEQNFAMIMDMLACAGASEEDESYKSPLDILFERLADREPGHIAVKQYNIFKLAAGKTAKSILVSLGVRLEKFNLEALQRLSAMDELHIRDLGEKKIALFCCIPDSDTTLNYVVGMLYTQIFQELYYSADKIHGGRLPVHVHFLLDEFANIALPDDFEKLLATMRSREISVSIIIQNMAQLKALFEKQWESIVGNADEFLFLGGNEKETHKYVSELLGKETLDTNTYGQTKGKSGSYSTNFQQTGRELMTPDEIRRMDNAKAILFIRGEYPILDNKYDILKHPNIRLTVDGGAPPYQHGTAPLARSPEEILLDAGRIEDYALLDMDDVEQLFDEEEKENPYETINEPEESAKTAGEGHR